MGRKETHGRCNSRPVNLVLTDLLESSHWLVAKVVDPGGKGTMHQEEAEVLLGVREGSEEHRPISQTSVGSVRSLLPWEYPQGGPSGIYLNLRVEFSLKRT